MTMTVHLDSFLYDRPRPQVSWEKNKRAHDTRVGGSYWYLMERQGDGSSEGLSDLST